MPTTYLLDLYDTLAHGDWATWRADLASLTGLSQGQISEAYEQTRRERNIGAFGSPAGDVRALLDAAGLDGALAEPVLVAETAFGDAIELYDDVLPTLATLRQRGHPTVLIGSTPQSETLATDLPFCEECEKARKAAEAAEARS